MRVADPGERRRAIAQVETMMRNSGKFDDDDVKHLVDKLFTACVPEQYAENPISIEVFSTAIGEHPEVVELFETCFS